MTFKESQYLLRLVVERITIGQGATRIETVVLVDGSLSNSHPEPNEPLSAGTVVRRPWSNRVHRSYSRPGRGSCILHRHRRGVQAKVEDWRQAGIRLGLCGLPGDALRCSLSCTQRGHGSSTTGTRRRESTWRLGSRVPWRTPCRRPPAYWSEGPRVGGDSPRHAAAAWFPVPEVRLGIVVGRSPSPAGRTTKQSGGGARASQRR